MVCGFLMKSLKKHVLKIWKKSWVPFRSYLLNSTANSAHFHPIARAFLTLNISSIGTVSWHWYPNVNNLLNTYNFHQQTYLVPLWKKNEYIAKENLSLVAYVQSSCDTPSGRDEYVSELMKHIKVDSYGHCLHNTDLPSSLRNPTVNNFSII